MIKMTIKQGRLQGVSQVRDIPDIMHKRGYELVEHPRFRDSYVLNIPTISPLEYLPEGTPDSPVAGHFTRIDPLDASATRVAIETDKGERATITINEAGGTLTLENVCDGNVDVMTRHYEPELSRWVHSQHGLVVDAARKAGAETLHARYDPENRKVVILKDGAEVGSQEVFVPEGLILENLPGDIEEGRDFTSFLRISGPNFRDRINTHRDSSYMLVSLSPYHLRQKDPKGNPVMGFDYNVADGSIGRARRLQDILMGSSQPLSDQDRMMMRFTSEIHRLSDDVDKTSHSIKKANEGEGCNDKVMGLYNSLRERRVSLKRLHSLRGQLRDTVRDYPGAIYDFSMALIGFDSEFTDKETADTLLRRGLVQRLIGNYDKAFEDFESAAEANPSTSLPHMWMGGIHLSYGRVEEAKQCYRKAVEVDPEASDAKEALERLEPKAKPENENHQTTNGGQEK